MTGSRPGPAIIDRPGPVVPTAGPPNERRRRPLLSAVRGKRRRRFSAWAFLLPVLVLQSIVVIGPSIGAAYFSLTDWSGFGSAQFIGLQNYQRMLTDDPDFFGALGNNIFYLVCLATIPFAMAVPVAGVLSRVRRGAIGYRLIYFLPFVLPTVVAAQIWKLLLSPSQGVGPWLIDAGIPFPDVAWLGTAATALPSIILVDIWHWWGFVLVVLLAAMQSIPADLYEVARLEGASRWQELRHVTLPGIRPTLVFLLLISSIGAFLAFDYIWVLTHGGPAGASEVLGTLVVKNGVSRHDAGYAAALGLTMTALAGVIIGLFVVLRRRDADI